MESSPLKEIASELPFFKTVNEREKLLGVVGALVLRQISLSKDAEIMGMGKEAFLEGLDAMRVEFSCLEDNDVETERKWGGNPFFEELLIDLKAMGFRIRAELFWKIFSGIDQKRGPRFHLI